MMFNFNTKNSGVINGFFNDIVKDERNKIAGVYNIYETVDGKHKEYTRTVRINSEGKKFFTWNKEVIMFDDFICYTPEELVEKINENARLYGEDLCRTLLKYGMDSLIVRINKTPMTTFKVDNWILGFEMDRMPGEEGKWIDYRFEPEFLHKPINSYKLLLVPVNPEYLGVYSRWNTYVDDMVSLFKACKDTYEVVVNTNKKENVA